MSDFSYVFLGNTANDGTGTPLRNAFQIIDENFANIAAGNANIIVNSPVNSVAGRTGNINLTVNDVLGAASIGYVSSLSAGNLTYIMGNSQNWTSNVSTISEALDQLAQRLKAAGF